MYVQGDTGTWHEAVRWVVEFYGKVTLWHGRALSKKELRHDHRQTTGHLLSDVRRDIQGHADV